MSLLLIGTNIFLGLTGGDVNGAATEVRIQQTRLLRLQSSLASTKAEVEAQKEKALQAQTCMAKLQPAKSRHIMVGLLAAVVTLIVNSICVTYFIGTGRWVSEVTMTYNLDERFDLEAKRLKITTFRWSLLGIVTVLAIAALGAASDPGTLRETTAKFVAPHYLLAVVGFFILAWAFWRQYWGIRKNGELIDQIMLQVRRVRSEKGLDIEEPASKDQGGSTNSSTATGGVT